jgi:death-on-curing protein
MSFLSSRDVYDYKYRGWRFPTLGFALRLHDLILEESGGLPGLKDEGALLSALHAPVDSAGGEDAYYYFFEKVAALGYRVARNHPFTDGNKRTSLGLIFHALKWNGYYLQWSDDAEVIVISLLGAGHLEIAGLRHALILACGLDLLDATL